MATDYNFNVDVILNVISKNMGKFNSDIKTASKTAGTLSKELISTSKSALLNSNIGKNFKSAETYMRGITKEATSQLGIQKLLSATDKQKLEFKKNIRKSILDNIRTQVAGDKQVQQGIVARLKTEQEIISVKNRLIKQEEAQRNKNLINQQKYLAQQEQLVADSASKKVNDRQAASMLKLQKATNLTALSQKDLINAFNKGNIGFTEQGKTIDKTTGKMVSFSRATQKVNKGMEKMDFGFLSLLFGGMALQRTFGSMYKSLQTSYVSMGDKNDKFVKSIDKTTGAFEYMKVALFDGFVNNPLVAGVIDSITASLVHLGDWADKHPNIAGFLVGVGGALAVIGTGMVILGQVQTLKLAALALKEMASVNAEKLRNLAGGLNDISNAKNKFGAANAITIGLNIGAAIVSGVELVKEFKANGFSGATFGYALATALAVAGAVTAIWNPGIGIALFVASTVTNKITDYLVETKNKKDMQIKTAQAVNEILGENTIDIGSIFGQSLNADEIELNGLNNQLKETKKLVDEMKNQQLPAYMGGGFKPSSIYSKSSLDYAEESLSHLAKKTDDLNSKILATAVAQLTADRQAIDSKLRTTVLDEQAIELERERIRVIDEKIGKLTLFGNKNSEVFQKELGYANDFISYQGIKNTILKDNIVMAGYEADEAERERDAQKDVTNELVKQNALRGVRSGLTMDEYRSRAVRNGRTVISAGGTYSPTKEAGYMLRT